MNNIRENGDAHSYELNKNMKFILVTGGVISGVGKGIIASSFGTILKMCGLRVTSIKIDPYINIDAGTFSPYEHGNTIFVVLCVWFFPDDNRLHRCLVQH